VMTIVASSGAPAAACTHAFTSRARGPPGSRSDNPKRKGRSPISAGRDTNASSALRELSAAFVFYRAPKITGVVVTAEVCEAVESDSPTRTGAQAIRSGKRSRQIEPVRDEGKGPAHGTCSRSNCDGIIAARDRHRAARIEYAARGQ
jgi:hypothetical protein